MASFYIAYSHITGFGLAAAETIEKVRGMVIPRDMDDDRDLVIIRASAADVTEAAYMDYAKAKRDGEEVFRGHEVGSVRPVWAGGGASMTEHE